MTRVAPMTLALTSCSIVAQLLGATLLPRTQGLTNPLATLLCAACFAVGVAAIAILVNRGVGLSVVMPIMAAITPLCAVVIGIFLYGESASPLKLMLLIVACVIVGWAGTL